MCDVLAVLYTVFLDRNRRVLIHAAHVIPKVGTTLLPELTTLHRFISHVNSGEGLAYLLFLALTRL